MAIYQLDPVRDERWGAFLEAHPEASIFHTRDWLQALWQTYGYVPVAFTTAPPGYPLTNGLPFCRISSWLSGRRLVSLPFSDHCAPLVESSEQLRLLLGYVQENAALEKWSYIELRPTDSTVSDDTDFGKSKVFFLHKLDLRPSLDKIFQAFHKDCVQRKIQRAAREGLVYEEGRSGYLLSKFYRLLLMTRRRHGLPAQPVQWFQNLIACLGEKAKVRVASKDGRPVASILTLRYKQTMVYKYGCSDHKFNKFGGTQMLLWEAIREAKNKQLSDFDLGRTDCDNVGLVVFKDRWGAVRTELVYCKHPARNVHNPSRIRQAHVARYIWSHVPGGVLATAGRVLYRHIG